MTARQADISELAILPEPGMANIDLSQAAQISGLIHSSVEYPPLYSGRRYSRYQNRQG